MFRFCRSKCHKNFKAKRNPRRVRWTKAYRKTHGKELTADPVYEFEKSKDTAVKYDRNVWINTVQAMERLDTIRGEREGRFWEERMKHAEHHKKEMIKSNLIRNETLIADPVIREKVDELREERDRKREARRNRHLNRNVDIGFDKDIHLKGPNERDVRREAKKDVKQSKKKKQQIARKQKQLNMNKNILMPKKNKNAKIATNNNIQNDAMEVEGN
jgi:large subunit ribosomal protein L24e